MCWANKCCFFISLDLASVVLGVGNLIFATISTVVTALLLLLQKYHEQDHNDGRHFLQNVLEFDMKKTFIDMIIIMALIISVMWIPFSSFLILGVRNNIPSLVLSYFVYGVIVTIICLLAAILEVINDFWIIAVVKTVLCLINIHFLVVVHTVYELMCRGKIFGHNKHNLMDIDEAFMETESEN